MSNRTPENGSTLNKRAYLLDFTLRGSNRRKIYRLLLSGPRTIAGISALTGIHLSNVSRVIKDFEKYGLVESTAPIYLKGRLYQLTSLALEIKSGFKEHTRFHMGK